MHPIIERARSENRVFLTEIESKELLKQAGVSVVDTKLAISKDETITLSQKLGFPVVLKIVSPDIVHKSDAGGVKLGLETPEQVEQAYDDILKTISQKYKEARIQGVSVQKMARPGIEVIIGMSKDVQFGPMIMFGLGGILVEILKDVNVGDDAGQQVAAAILHQSCWGQRFKGLVEPCAQPGEKAEGRFVRDVPFEVAKDAA